MAVTGLDGYGVAPDANDAATLAPIDATTENAVADGAADAAGDESRSDASNDAGPSDAGPVDAGPCGKCPSGTARTLCVANACTETRRVFVTRKGYGSLFGAVATADSECQTVANSAKLGGNWRAWFGVSGNVPRDRFGASTAPYRLLDGTQIASSSAVILSKNTNIALEHAIDRDETNTPVVAGEQQEVWTGTNVNGDVGNGTCDHWTSSALGVTGTVGVTNKATPEWTAVYLQTCDRTGLRLYCFEQ